MYSTDNAVSEIMETLENGGEVSAGRTKDSRVIRLARWYANGQHKGTHTAEMTLALFRQTIDSVQAYRDEKTGRCRLLPSQLAAIRVQDKNAAILANIKAM